MDKPKALVMCGVFAISDMGLANPAVDRVARAMTGRWCNTVQSSVYFFGESYFEDEEMAAGFVEEGEDWYKNMLEMTDEYFAKTWPDMAKLWDDAVALNG